MKRNSKLILLAAIVAMSAALPGRGQPAPVQVKMTDRAAARFLDQATWGPTSPSIGQLQQMGIPGWLEWQFSLNSSDLPDQPQYTKFRLANPDSSPVKNAFLQNAVAGEDQLRQRVAFALSEIWVVSYAKIGWAYGLPPYWRLLRDNAFKNYRDTIKAVTLNPAMGFYLDMANNNKGDPAYGTSPNENYARELMQLFTFGLTQLHLDGSPILDQNNNPVATFSGTVVPNLAKALTGWTYATPPGNLALDNNDQYFFGQMFAVERNHDTTAKTIFGNITIPAGQTAQQDLESVIDSLMQQPTMAPFISKQLIQHLITSNPSPAYVQRVSGVFLNNGLGVRGDMRMVITAILTDPEARAGDEPGILPNPNFGHLREPVLFMANVLRGLDATLGKNTAIPDYLAKLGQDLLTAPSVFSYFSPSFTIRNGLLGPEFEIYSTQTAGDRANIIDTVLYGSFDPTTKFDLTPFELAASDSIDVILDSISKVFLHHYMSSDLYRAAYSAGSAAGGGMGRVRAALYIVLTSSEYQIIQ